MSDIGDFLLGSGGGNIFAWDEEQRKRQAGNADTQIQGFYENDPGTFWQDGYNVAGATMGGANDWLNAFFSGSYGMGGGAHGASAQGFGAKAGLSDMGDEALQMLPSERLRQNIYGAGSRAMGAQAAGAERSIMDRIRLSGGAGDLSSPATLAMMADIKRKSLAAQGEGYAKFEADFSQAAGGRRAAALMANAQNKTSASIATAGNKTQASVASAQNRTSASIANAGLRGQMAGIGADAALGVLRLAGDDEDRTLDKYRLLHDMNMGFQRSVGSTDPQAGHAGDILNLARGAYDIYKGGSKKDTTNTGTSWKDYAAILLGGVAPAANTGQFGTTPGSPQGYDINPFDDRTGGNIPPGEIRLFDHRRSRSVY